MSEPLPTPITITVRQPHVDVLRRHRFFTKLVRRHQDYTEADTDAGWDLKKPETVTFRHRIYIEPYSAVYRRKYISSLGGTASHGLTSIGFGSYTFSPMPAQVEIGRHCSFSNNILFLDYHHPLTRLSTGHFSYKGQSSSLIAAALEERGSTHYKVKPFSTMLGKPYPKFGHDVWIGQGAVFSLGITVGTGAVIAANSVVTKNVAPYSIVGGNPAKHIRFRFDQEIVERLLLSEWWRYHIADFADMPIEDPPKFLDLLEKRKAFGDLQPYEPAPLILPDAWRDID